MTGIGQAAEGCFDVVPAPFVFETALDELGDECASTPGARTPVDLGHEVVVQGYVQTHGPDNTISSTRMRRHGRAVESEVSTVTGRRWQGFAAPTQPVDAYQQHRDAAEGLVEATGPSGVGVGTARTRPVAAHPHPGLQDVEVPIGGEDPEIPQQAEASDQEVVPGQGDAVLPQSP